MEIIYDKKKVETRQFLSPKETQIKPTITYSANPNELYTLILYDPNSVSQSGYTLHWIVANIPGNNIEKGNVLLPYMGPNPPKSSGTHHYIFIVYKQIEKIISFSLKERNLPFQKPF
jgi:phosphatidylethanolamine-binding protein (PEBP) family uncharacterized protein